MPRSALASLISGNSALAFYDCHFAFILEDSNMRARSILQTMPFATDVMIAAWQFQNYHPQSTRVVVDPDTNEIMSMCVYRPTHCGVVEEQNKITIPFEARDYMKLHDVKALHPPFPVYAWEIERKRGQKRGLFRMEKRCDISQYVLHRIPDVLCNADAGEEEGVDDDVHFATQKAIMDACGGELSDDDNGSDASSVYSPKVFPANHQPVLQSRLFSQRANLVPESSPPPKRGRGRPIGVTRDPGRFGLPTKYRSVTYRSRKEARFALALSEMGIPYIYEPMVFSRPSGGTYKPDYFLPRQQLWVELKPQRPHLEEELKCEEMSAAGFRVVLMYGESIEHLPFRTEKQAKLESGSRDYKHKDGLRGMAWIDGEKLPGDTVFVVGASPRKGGSPLEVLGGNDKPHLDQVCSTRDMRWDEGSIKHALSLAGAEKFQ